MKKYVLALGLILVLCPLVDSAISYTYQILEVRIGANNNSNKTIEALIKYTSTEDSEFEKTKWIVFTSSNIQSLLQIKGEIDGKVTTGQ